MSIQNLMKGTIAITNDGQNLYFTRNDFLDGDYEKSEVGIAIKNITKPNWSMVNGKI